MFLTVNKVRILSFCDLFQPLRLDIKRKLSARSDRVKCVDLHPTEPWMLASLYNGNVHIWNSESQVLDSLNPTLQSDQ